MVLVDGDVLILTVFGDAGDAVTHRQERITSAGASVTTKEGCQNSSTSPSQLTRQEDNQRIETSQPQKLPSKGGARPPFDLPELFQNKEALIPKKAQNVHNCPSLQACPHIERRNPGTLNTGNEGTQRL